MNINFDGMRLQTRKIRSQNSSNSLVLFLNNRDGLPSAQGLWVNVVSCLRIEGCYL
jgi:hypothetical protein